MSTARTRCWIEAGLALLTGCLLVLTLITREWIEALTGWDPDGGSGSLERGILVGLLLASLLFGVLARVEWKRHLVASA